MSKNLCIGCGLCAKTLPVYYEMKNNKAIIKQLPKNKNEMEDVVEMVERCPVNSIVFRFYRTLEEEII